ncbi:MAG: hypothetical protein ABEJ31_13995 [Haloarculaceae archaeon]
MSEPGVSAATERDRLIFGAGFAFGVVFTLLVLAVVLSPLVPGPVSADALLHPRVLVPIGAAIALAAVASLALYALALPERGLGLREGASLGDRGGDRERDAE